MSLKVCDVGEKELINIILDISASVFPDDTAVSDISNLKNLISTSDMMIQSKHFPSEMSYYQMGFKAVTVNVSDLAAMGAKPLGFLLAMAVPRDLLLDDFCRIIEGVHDACSFYDIPLIGGDTNESDEIILSGTALGSASQYLLKSGFSKGDLVAVTGEVGIVAEEFKTSKFTDKTLKPVARIKEGQYLNEIGATSATDITDGLVSELYELASTDKNSGFLIYEDKLKNKDLYFGEDFELLFTISKDKLDLIPDFIVIGEVTDSSKVEMKLENGEIKELPNKGYNHLKD